MLALIILVGLLLAFANGANDNFKGVATLRGSGTVGYSKALAWATLTTALGSATAIVLAKGLLHAFSGKGLVPVEVAAQPEFAASVALAAGATVLLATRFGFPISTTHGLIGALLGAGWLASGGVNVDKLVSSFLVPLAVSPFLAIALASAGYIPLRALRRRLGIQQETCVCVEERVVAVVPGTPGTEAALASVSIPALTTGTRATCRVRYDGKLAGIEARPVLNFAHFASAGAVSFARGLNDTPKIAALLLIGGVLTSTPAILMVGVAIALGGWFFAKRVAHTMAHDVTAMNPGQGFTANAVTALLVIGASKLGVPVSTTHVSCGSLFGIGLVSQNAHWRKIGQILLAWLLTLPCAAALAALFYGLLA